MEEIKAGEYVRTIDGIKKIVQVNEGNLSTYYSKYIVYPEYKNSKSINIKNILKHSFNIIDLIELGDFVNGEKVVRIVEADKLGDEELTDREIYVGFADVEKRIFEEDIKIILTKEMYTANCYEVK